MNKFDLIKDKIIELLKNSAVEEDYVHAQYVWKWVLKLKPDADTALQIAALGHDIDRAIPDKMIKKGDYTNYDEYKKYHALNSAKIIGELLEKYGFDEKVISKVKLLIENHEVGGEGDAEVLKESDSLAFFEHALPFHIKAHTHQETKDKIKFMYTRLSENSKELINKFKFQDEQINNLVKETIFEIK